MPSSCHTAASQDALNGAAVEPFEDLRFPDKFLQPPEGEEVLSCLLHDGVGECGPAMWLFISDVYTGT